MCKINFFSEDILFSLKNESTLANWINDLVLKEGLIIEQLNYIFCSDEYLLNINKDYLEHDYYTDIIAFDNSENEFINGDIFISIERANENWQGFSQSAEKEIYRLLSHGVLHLIGYDDKTIEDKEIMTQKEDYYLSLLS